MPLLLLFLLGCVPRHEGAYVRHIRFAGNGRGVLNDKSDSVLRGVVTHPYGRSNRTPPDPELLAEDGRRLEIWLAHKGYFDAKFLGWVQRSPAMRRRSRPVDLLGYVELGEPSRVVKLEVEGLDRLSGPIRNRVLDGITLREGEIFDRGLYLETLDLLPRLLQENAYAYARAEGEVWVDGHEVTVKLKVDPGPACRLGTITVKGADGVPEKRVREQLTFATGEGFKSSELAKSRTRLFGMRVFSMVSIAPQLSDPPTSTVPIVVEVKEGKSRSIKAGISTGYDPGRAWALASLGFTQYNFAHQAWRLSTVTSGGYALAFDLVSLEGTAGPLLSQEIKLDMPRIIGPVGLVNEGKAELGVELGYAYFDAEYAPAVSLQLNRVTTALVGYRARYYQYLDLSETGLPAAVDSLELNRNGQYLLSMLEQRLLYDGRNDPVRPTRGWYATALLAEAGRPVGGDYRFLKSELELRTYRSLLVALARLAPRFRSAGSDELLRGASVAMRVAGGVILPYGSEEESKVPYDERFVLGGGNTVRGWQVDALGPPCLVCSSTDGTVLPAGGLSMLYGNVELRKMGRNSIGGAAFLDVGRSWLDLPLLVEEPLQYTVGGGLRYESPVGPIRLDLGVRLGDDPMFVDEPRFGIHFGLSEMF